MKHVWGTRQASKKSLAAVGASASAPSLKASFLERFVCFATTEMTKSAPALRRGREQMLLSQLGRRFAADAAAVAQASTFCCSRPSQRLKCLHAAISALSRRDA